MRRFPLYLAIGFIAILASVRPARAATTLFIEGPAAVRPDTEVTYAIRGTLTEPINAVGMTVVFDTDAVRIVRFSPADAVVRDWLERSVSSGSVRLEGIIPGGTSAQDGTTVALGYLTLRFTRDGRTTLSVSDPEIYLHQPAPTRDTVVTRALSVTVSSDAPSSTDTLPDAADETRVSVFSAPEFADGAWSLAFDIRTAGGPLPRVLLRERFLGLLGGWREISSPASLSDQARVSILELGIPAGDDVRIVYREVPLRLIVLASLLGVAAVGYAMYRRMKH
jgi:hypothetical protein